MTDIEETTAEALSVTEGALASIEEVATEAREKFSLIDRITNRDMRTVKLDLGYNEVNSEKLSGIESALGQLGQILDRAEENGARAEGLKKEAAKLKARLKKADAEDAAAMQAEIDSMTREAAECENLLKQVAPLRAKHAEMEASADTVRQLVKVDSLSVELRAIPYAIARASARRARSALGITEKGIPADKQDAFEEQQLLELAYDQVVRFRDNHDGREGTKLSMEELKAIRDYMPMSQSAKFFTAVSDLQFTNAISESAIAQADF